MRIAQVAPLTEAVPPKLYGGTERVISWLTEELVDSWPRSHLVRKWQFGDQGEARADVAACAAPRRHRARSECAAHDDARKGRARAANSTFSTSISTIIRSRCCRGRRRRSSRQCTAASTCPSTSRYSRRSPLRRSSRSPSRSGGPFRRRDWVATVPHGLPEDLLDAASGASPAIWPSSAASLRRRRVDRAIGIAQRCGLQLKIAAKVDRADRDYFDETIKPLLDRRRRVHRRDRRRREVRIPERGDRPARADRLARAVRPGDDRGDGVRHAGDRLQPRLRAGGRRDGVTGFVVEDETRPRVPCVDLGSLSRGRSAGASRSDSPPGAWRKTMSRSIAA